ncbi:putative (Acyl-carrier-protein) S-malonyltransferase [Desulfamplus magnetovallimortis]|uniref:Putative (Acyl-carrier-protein) S-malonyltransferase n=1 Tax=Desulfamplus magnetovallimortis TaxID=1246637 RepID=A0A1W1H7K5_9BACT|nr:type I polyketide synthase [Desulfamplus magnetovallimortis]SLM28414.1 putative (Acyl-carrier-protein) S-malonyltransferase [Desulfamplus magnetovallimortis]
MLSRILNSRLPLIIYNPCRVFSLNFFTAVFKAGALPVFDTEFLSRQEIIKGIKELINADILFGLRLVEPENIEKDSVDNTKATVKGSSTTSVEETSVSSSKEEFQALLNEISDFESPNIDTIVVSINSGFTSSSSSSSFEFKNFSDTKLVLETRNININHRIDALSPHALILKGNEAGGRVSNYSSFVLMQWYLKNSTLPIFIHGGVGRNTASGMFAAGVSGVVLDSQVWLCDESPLSDNFRKLLSTLDESDSMEISTDSRHVFRVFAKLGTRIAKDLKEKGIVVSDKKDGSLIIYKEIEDNITGMDNSDAAAVQSLFFLGQDGFFAKDFAKLPTDLAGMISQFFKDIGSQLNDVDAFDPMRANSPMAEDHGTRLPLIQGPMANVSDNPDFAVKVFEAGALPFFAVGSLPPVLADNMLKNGSEKVKIFGAGLVGIEAFNPAIEKHLEMVKKYKAPFALFAGGIPSQVIELEKAGTKTYLHTPSISMMENAIKSGCTRFIFEGKEAGGHIGSLSSLVLWDAAIAKLKEKDDETLSGLSLVFAGGISTCFASHFISGISASLAAKGVKIGIQVGTAYLFAKEIVDTKSIKEQYQTILFEEDETMVIGNSVGLASRTAPTEFARMMIQKEKEMIKQGEKLEVRKKTFEKNNIGSLLIGAKGFLPDFKRMGEEYYTWFEGEEHRKKGNFLVGDSLAFFKSSVTLADIHSNFFDRYVKQALFYNLDRLEIFSSNKKSVNDEIAVIGMGCLLPDAHDPESLWENILSKRYSIKEMPDDRIRKDLYYDADKSAEDRAYTMLAGYVDDFLFDQDRFGYDDQKAAKLSRTQKMLLETAYQAVENAGYLDNETLQYDTARCPSGRVGVIIATCLGNELGNELQMKYHFPEVLSMLRKTDAFNELDEEQQKILVEDLQKGMEGKNAGYDPVHGMLLNIEASRIARHLGIRGVNYVVDAACASSFSAIDAAVQDLLSGTHDQMVVGGVNTHLAPESFVGFCKMGALSANGSFPFDKRADGFILGEGSAVFILKRMKDAIRDNDNIIGIIKSIGGSSDGRGKAIAAPNVDGQVLALKRCYENMLADNVAPEDIDFIEAHGTSTIMGDQAELQTLKQVYARSRTGISSIKSQIGHLLGGAGAAGLVKALLAVQKGVLPPTANFETLSPNHDLAKSLLYIITEPEEWKTTDNRTRKAAVSSYGFGGINYHVVVEEFRPGYMPLNRSIFRDPSHDFNDERIVIAGMGVRLPGAKDCDEFWKNLQSGEKQLSDIPEERFDNRSYAEFDKKSIYHLPMVSAGVIKDFKFNNIKYRMPPTIVRSLERGQLLGLDAADEAITTSGLGKLLEKGNRTGVILATMTGERQNKNILRVRKSEIAEIIEKSLCCDSSEIASDKAAKGDLESSKDKIVAGKTVSSDRNGDMNIAGKIASELVEAIRKRIPENNEDTTPGLLSNIISGRIANHFGLNGVNYVVDASCASAVIAIDNAIRNIASGRLDFVLAGGVDANLFPAVLMAFKRLGLLSATEPRFFDDRADGYAMGEGAAIHVLTTYGKAKEAGMEILAEVNHCTIKSSVPDHLLAPSEQTFVSTINACYQESGIRKEDVKHLDLFAFSNILGDMIEKQVVEKCFHHELYCGNIKPQFGYFKSANPAVSLAKMVLMNRNRTLLPNFNYDREHTTLKNGTILKVANEMVPVSDREPLRFAFNVNGIGGNHCHMIMSTLPSWLTRTTVAKSVEKPLLSTIKVSSSAAASTSLYPSTVSVSSGDTVSVKTDASLSGVQKRDSVASKDFSGSSNISRQSQLSGGSNISRQGQLSGSGNISRQDITPKSQFSGGGGKNQRPFSSSGGKRQKMVALLSGQGAQRPGMMKELFDSDPEIRDIMERGEEIFMEQRGYSLLKIMFNEDQRLNLTENTQPAVFLSSAALFERLSTRGFNPDCFIGHSVGEYTALFCSGMLDFDDAMRLIIKRSDLMKEAATKYPGKIMVVFRNEKDTAASIRESGLSDIYITNKNSENQTAVSGNAEAIESYCAFLNSQNIVFRRLNLSGAFHTPLFRDAAEQLREYLATITFNDVPFSRVISNVTARPYPEDRMAVKDLLARQITSPVEFIKSVEYVYESGRTHYIEIGPGRLLANLLKKINIAEYQSIVAVDAKQGELKSFEACRDYLKSYSTIFSRQHPQRDAILPARKKALLQAVESRRSHQAVTLEDDFDSFKRENAELAEKLLHDEFIRRKREAAMEAVERFNFTTDPIVISGVSVGLPGKANRVFASDNFDRILEGSNFIEPLTLDEQLKITDKNITRLFKQPDGNARFVEITRTEDVIHLAGQLGYFSLTDEYGIKAQYDISMALGIAAGIEALKDAGIPLVMQYKKSASGGKMIPDGFALPKEMQDETGVIITSLFPSNETLINEMERYFYDKLFLKPYEEFENIYYYLMENVKDATVKASVTDWFFKIRNRKKDEFGPYRFDRNFMTNACPLGSAHLAQIIRAKGPNTLVSSACASTTQAIGIAEDWIRVGRCRRVIVIGGENATSSAQNQWIGTGFLALGAATVKKRVSEAAKPFDSDRNGTILGSGAVGLVVEQASLVQERGMRGQAEILGTHMANSAYHTFNIDVAHMASEMKRFITKIEEQHHLKQEDYASKLLFMSHETYTPARGGSADAEVTALKTAFSDHLNNICITNTKGFTGHTLGAAIEDVVMIKALQRRQAPPIANLTKIPDHFKELNFSSRKKINSEYGLHLAAGFGSHFAFLFVRRIEEKQFENNREYALWLERITESYNPELKIIDNTLCVVPGELKGNVSKTSDSFAPKTAISSGAIPSGATPSGAIPSGATPSGVIRSGATTSGATTSGAIPSGGIPSSVPTSGAMTQKPRTESVLASTPEVSREASPTTAATSAPMSAPSTSAISAPDTSGIIEKVKEIIAEQTGYTSDMLESDLDLEADLGIDTVKQVEIFAKSAGVFGFAVPEDLKLRDLNTIDKLAAYINSVVGGHHTAPVAGDAAQSSTTAAISTEVAVEFPGISSSDLSHYMDRVKEIIAEQTGYTSDMLEPDLDLEADLGIDTVKQVEIFAKSAATFGFAVPEDLKLRDLNTIAKLSAYVASRTGATYGVTTDIEVSSQSVARSESLQSESPTEGVSLTSKTTLASIETTLAKIREIIANQTGYTEDMLDADLDLEGDLGIDTVKQVEIFANAAGHFGFPVPEDLKLRDLNTIAKLAAYVDAKIAPSGIVNDNTETGINSEINDSTGFVDNSEVIDGSLQINDNTDDNADGNDDPDDPEPTPPAGGGKPEAGDMKRLVPVIRETGLPVTTMGETSFLKGKKVIMTLDNAGFAQRIATAIKREGCQVTGILPVSPSVKTSSEKASSEKASSEKASSEKTSSEKTSTAMTSSEMPSSAETEDVKKDFDFCDDIIFADFSSDEATVSSAEKISATISAKNQEPDIFINLAPLDLVFRGTSSPLTTEQDEKSSPLTPEQHVKSFFLLIKKMYGALNQQGKMIAALSINSVVFPHDDSLGFKETSGLQDYSEGIEPCFAGISGMMKSLAKEMPDTRVKMVDISTSLEQNSEKQTDSARIKEAISKLFLDEISSHDPRVETGYKIAADFKDIKKYVMRLEEQLCKTGTPLVNSADCLLVTGGARGITFEILKSLVSQYKTDLVIMGRSDIDDIVPEFLDESYNESAIMAALKQRGKGDSGQAPLKPLELKKAASKIISIRDSRKNIEILKSQGINVTYLAADVADRDAVEDALKSIDHIDGVIHAAGLEESMPFEKKSFDSFLRVFNTKVSGCANVISALKGKGVRFHVGFSSVTAKFGNEGQTDYTAANDMMAKILMKEEANSPQIFCKIMDWTAWSGAGMATRETVQKVLTERGLKFLPLETGIAFFMDELTDSETREVVFTGLDHAFDRDGILTIAPFLDSRFDDIVDDTTVFSRNLNIEKDRFLLDHSMEETPVFLGATGVETMAEAAMAIHGAKGHGISEIKNFSIPYGIKLLQKKPKDIMISVKPGLATVLEKKSGQQSYNCRITSQFVNNAGVAMGDPKLHYQSEVIIDHLFDYLEGHSGKKRDIPELKEVENGERLAELIYHPQRLFMDDIFRTIQKVLSFDGETVITEISDRSRSTFFTEDPYPCFLTDVILLDGMFQTGGVFQFFTDSVIVLPYKIGSLKFHRRGEKDAEYLCITTRTASDDETDTFNIDLVDREGNYLMELVDFQMVKLQKLPENLRIS